MRQLITRIEDRLHRRLKERAAGQGRSMNALVTEILSRAVAADDERARYDTRLAALGIRPVYHPPKKRPRSRDEVIAKTRGLGPIVSAALEAERASR